ncbi:uncharacterized protein BJ212DRAFT_1304109 [Suillus subaureus]|uniref:Myb/SANT-like domain-containing protein n=1 Tax=Suillus subaureus TaxID=48587 RepID=A0A9P7J6P5_9AGAM|nr:uncharacterized protein BJ212DRAFT_1304109 [Suillus subaureus]KAG1805324.1 hypothetical protein BJ212DRAFT_1304109 [Suillus subaureus]
MQIAQEDQGDSNSRSKEKAQWNNLEIEMFNKAASTITAKNIRMHGPIKTGVHCRNKFTSLKGSFNQINKYCHKSGVHWDPQIGANIEGTAAEGAWTSYITNLSNAGMKQFKNGWRFYAKMEQLLTKDSAAHGVVAYNLLADAAPSGTSVITATGSEDILAGPSTNNTSESAGPSMTDRIGDEVTHEPITWNILHLNTGLPVALSSIVAAPPLSSTSSLGKHSHSDMLFDHSPPASTSVSQMSDTLSDKKLKLSTQGSSRSCVSISKKVVKEATSTTALMNLQGTINHLMDSLTIVFGEPIQSYTSKMGGVMLSAGPMYYGDCVYLLADDGGDRVKQP